MYATHANYFSLDHATRFSKDSVTTGPEGFKLVLHSRNAAMPCASLHGLGVTQR